MAFELPEVGKRVERARLDIKRDYGGDAATQRGEMAKDVAAFANALGGRIIVGAHEGKDGELAKWAPLAPARVTEVRRLFEEAVRELTRPAPVFDVEAAPVPGEDVESLVIVHVEPFPGQAVGVVVKNAGDVAYRFPVRVGTRTIHYGPEQLGLIMDPSYRRKAQLLATIPPDVVVGIMGGGLLAPRMYRIVEVDVERNSVFVERTNESGQRWKRPIGISIDSVANVYARFQGEDPAWLIQIAGMMPDDLAPTPEAKQWTK